MGKKFNVAGIIDGAQKVLGAVEDLAPIAKQLGGPEVANVATIAIAATAVLQNVLQRVEDGAVVMTTQDRAKVDAMLEELQRANDLLNEAVIAS